MEYVKTIFSCELVLRPGEESEIINKKAEDIIFIIPLKGFGKLIQLDLKRKREITLDASTPDEKISISGDNYRLMAGQSESFTVLIYWLRVDLFRLGMKVML